MLPYEYAADRYVSLMMRYNAGGILLNKIPLLNKFNLRERIIANAYWGSISTSNYNYNKLNTVKTTGNTPFTEAGVGIGNIFNVFSVDAIWRLTNKDIHAKTTSFGIYTSVTLNF